MMTLKKLSILVCVPLVVVLAWSDSSEAQLLMRRNCRVQPVYCPPVYCCPTPQPTCCYYTYDGCTMMPTRSAVTTRRFGYYPPATVVRAGNGTVPQAAGTPTLAQKPMNGGANVTPATPRDMGVTPAPVVEPVEKQPAAVPPTAGDATTQEATKEESAATKTPVLKGLVETAQAEGNLKEMLKLAETAGLLDEVKGSGPHTIFAPSDEVLGKLNDMTQELAKNPDRLRQLLFHHAISDVSLKADELVAKKQMMPLVEPALQFTKTDEGVRVNDALIIKADIRCTNGMLHIIDGVLVPEKKAASPQEPTEETPPAEKPQPEAEAEKGGDSGQ